MPRPPHPPRTRRPLPRSRPLTPTPSPTSAAARPRSHRRPRRVRRPPPLVPAPRRDHRRGRGRRRAHRRRRHRHWVVGTQRLGRAARDGGDRRGARRAVADAEAEGGGEVTLVSSADQALGRHRRGLPELGADQTYELWYIDDAGADSAGRSTWRAPRRGACSRAHSRRVSPSASPSNPRVVRRNPRPNRSSSSPRSRRATIDAAGRGPSVRV